MSGIAGFVRLDGAPAARSALEPMTGVMTRRGPHGSGVYVDGGVALGHRALHGMPEALLEQQPCARGRTVVTADLRLDNRVELAEALGIPSGELATLGDAALVLRAYEAWGEECPGRLLGDFAFALWDAAERRLFCARDCFGARPFVYGRTSRVFAFASDTRALHAFGELPRRVDEGRVADFLVDAGLETIDATSTFYQDIVKLAPGHQLTLRDGRVAIRRYWAPEPGERPPMSHDATIEAFRSAFVDAVRCRARGEHVGAMLSGGLDSSTIVAVARADRTPLRTFSAVGDDPETCPDRRYVEAAIAQGGLEPTVVRPSDLAGYADAILGHFEASDDPFDSYAASIPLPMYAAAARSGVRVLLDGVDGDLVTSQGGNGLLYALREGRPGLAWRNARGAARYYGERPAPFFLLEGVLPHLWQTAVRPRLPTRAIATSRLLRGRWAAHTSVRSSVIQAAFARSIDIEGRLAQMRRSREAGRGGQGPGWDHATNIAWAATAVAFERYDRAAASQSVETSHPFFDRRLVELCLSIGWSEKVREGVPKSLLRDAFAGVVAEPIRTRRWSLSPHPPFKHALVRALEPWVAAQLDKIDVAAPWMDVHAVRAAWRDWRSGRPDLVDVVWEAATFLSWLDRAVGRDRSGVVVDG